MALLMRVSARGLVLLATLGLPPAAAAQSAAPAGSLEYQVKAAYLLNFARYVSWPEGAFASPTAPLPICVLGADPFGNALDEVVAGQGARARPIIVRRAWSVAEVRYCPLVFVSNQAWRERPGIIEELRGHGVLTVGDSEAFARAGGIIGFVVEENAVRFTVNLDAGERAGFRLDSRMLALAARLFRLT